MSTGISENANSPGVQPKQSPLARNNGNGSPPAQSSPMSPQITLTPGQAPPPPPPPPSMGSLAMGMPFQVFPTGPAPPSKNQQLSAPQTNGNNRKSPKSFEPPPMGCRPEIKIPANPMELLRKSPKPQPKNDFWVQEYVQEKTGDEETRPQYGQHQSTPSSAQAQRQQSPLRFAERTPTPPERDFSSHLSTMKLDEIRTVSPVQAVRSSPVARQSPAPSSPAVTAKQVKMEPIQTPKTPSQNYQQQPSCQQPTQTTYQQPQLQIYHQPAQQRFEQPAQPTYQQQQNQQRYEDPTQTYQQAHTTFQPLQAQATFKPQEAQATFQPQTPQGGKVILSTMPSRPQQQAQQHVTKLLTSFVSGSSMSHFSVGRPLHPTSDESR